VNNIVPTQGLDVFSALNTLVSQTSRLAIVRPDNPPPGVAGYLFNIVTDDAVDLESEITDHYIENNTAIQDHIALKPEMISVRGLVAELAGIQVTQGNISQQPNALPGIPGYLPEFTDGTIQTMVQNEIEPERQQAAISDSQSLFGYYNSRAPQEPNQTKQSYIFGYFYQLWKGRQLFSVETPWGIWNNMAIMSLNATQGEDTRTVSDIRIQFKRISKVETVTITPGNLAGRATLQRSGVAQNGVVGLQNLTYGQSQTTIAGMTPVSTVPKTALYPTLQAENNTGGLLVSIDGYGGGGIITRAPGTYSLVAVPLTSSGYSFDYWETVSGATPASTSAASTTVTVLSDTNNHYIAHFRL
jgi:hypothetical protein